MRQQRQERQARDAVRQQQDDDRIGERRARRVGLAPRANVMRARGDAQQKCAQRERKDEPVGPPIRRTRCAAGRSRRTAKRSRSGMRRRAPAGSRSAAAWRARTPAARSRARRFRDEIPRDGDRGDQKVQSGGDERCGLEAGEREQEEGGGGAARDGAERVGAIEAAHREADIGRALDDVADENRQRRAHQHGRHEDERDDHECAQREAQILDQGDRPARTAQASTRPKRPMAHSTAATTSSGRSVFCVASQPPRQAADAEAEHERGDHDRHRIHADAERCGTGRAARRADRSARACPRRRRTYRSARSQAAGGLPAPGRPRVRSTCWVLACAGAWWRKLVTERLVRDVLPPASGRRSADLSGRGVSVPDRRPAPCAGCMTDHGTRPFARRSATGLPSALQPQDFRTTARTARRRERRRTPRAGPIRSAALALQSIRCEITPKQCGEAVRNRWKCWEFPPKNVGTVKRGSYKPLKLLTELCREAEGGGLLNVIRLKRRIEGSNPSAPPNLYAPCRLQSGTGARSTNRIHRPDQRQASSPGRGGGQRRPGSICLRW